jgi:FtsP/CotA-like multicopper oxidase with cupredoxin domain
MLLGSAAAAAEPAKVFDLDAAAGPRPATIRVSRGDDVELRWSSDKRVTLHLHGYDIARTVSPQSGGTMAFKASIPGRFPVSEHGSGGRHGRAILYLEVHP